MSYYCTGSGEITCSNVEDVNKVVDILSEIFDVCTDKYKKNRIYITYEYGNYHEAYVIEALAKAQPYIKEGKIEFTGEDNELWAFIKDKGDKTFFECEAVIQYNKLYEI